MRKEFNDYIRKLDHMTKGLSYRYLRILTSDVHQRLIFWNYYFDTEADNMVEKFHRNATDSTNSSIVSDFSTISFFPLVYQTIINIFLKDK